MTTAAAPGLGAAAAPMLRVAATWGTTIVGVRLLSRGEDCALGEQRGALAVMPEGLHAPTTPLKAAGGGWELDARGAVSGVLMLRGREENLLQLARTGAPVPVLPGDYGLIQYGLFSIFFQYTTAGSPLKTGFISLEPLVGLSVFSSIVLHLGIIGLLIINWTPPEYQLPPELVSPEDYAARFGLKRVLPEMEPPTASTDKGGGGQGIKDPGAKDPKKMGGGQKIIGKEGKAGLNGKEDHSELPGEIKPTTNYGGLSEALADTGTDIKKTLAEIQTVANALGGLNSDNVVLGAGPGTGLKGAGAGGGGTGAGVMFGSGTMNTGWGPGTGGGFGSGAGGPGGRGTGGFGSGGTGGGTGGGNGPGNGAGNGPGEHGLAGGGAGGAAHGGLNALLDRFQTLLLGKDAFNLWNGRTVIFSWDAIFIAAGAITGMRVSLSMFVSGTVCWAVFVPILQHHGYISAAGGFRDVVQWTLWGGVACMVASSLFGFVLQWRSALRAFRGLGRMFSRGTAHLDELDAIETPNSWFVIGQLGSLVALGWLAHHSFGMPYWQSALAVVLSFALALVACRVTGETDTTPMGAMGKVTQLIFGALNPGNINVNLMSANITSAAAGSSADLLTDLKSGYLLGAHPRKQFIAQFAGIFIGTIATVLAFSVIVPDASVLGTKEFPAPAAQTWAAVAQALAHGLEALHPVKVWSIVVGALVGLVLSILSTIFPKQQKYIPSASAAGLAWIFQWYYGLLFFLGALIVHVFQKKAPEKTEEFTFPIASGVIAGGSLMGVLLIFWENGPAMYKIFSGLFGGK